MRILVAVPTYDSIYPDTYKSIWDMEKGSHDVDFNFFRGYDVANARNAIASHVLEHGYDYVLMVDSDILVPKNALLSLMECVSTDTCPGIAVGYYPRRSSASTDGNSDSVVFAFGGKDYNPCDAYTMGGLSAREERKLKIRGCGLGCALINKSVFETVPRPWFKWVAYDNGAQLSEDLYFCEKVNKVGISIYVDTRVACGHMIRIPVWK